MATFNITANGTTAGQTLASASTAAFFGGTPDTAKIRLEGSPDGTNWAPLVSAPEIGPVGQKDAGKGIVQCVLPAGWRVRCVTVEASPFTNAVVTVD